LIDQKLELILFKGLVIIHVEILINFADYGANFEVIDGPSLLAVHKLLHQVCAIQHCSLNPHFPGLLLGLSDKSRQVRHESVMIDNTSSILISLVEPSVEISQIVVTLRLASFQTTVQKLKCLDLVKCVYPFLVTIPPNSCSNRLKNCLLIK